MKTQTTFGKINYEVYGHGTPLILLHGNGEDHTIFIEAIEELSKYYQVYAFDSLGHGDSDSLKSYHYSIIADSMLEAIQSLHLSSCPIFGFSDGAIIATIMEMKSPTFSHMILGGINISPKGIKWPYRIGFMCSKNPLIRMMIHEPNFDENELKNMICKKEFIFGEKDLISSKHIKKLKKIFPNDTFHILKNEDHGSYVIHTKKLSEILLPILKANQSFF